jgi:hypothetical protein
MTEIANRIGRGRSGAPRAVEDYQIMTEELIAEWAEEVCARMKLILIRWPNLDRSTKGSLPYRLTCGFQENLTYRVEFWVYSDRIEFVFKAEDLLHSRHHALCGWTFPKTYLAGLAWDDKVENMLLQEVKRRLDMLINWGLAL